MRLEIWARDWKSGVEIRRSEGEIAAPKIFFRVGERSKRVVRIVCGRAHFFHADELRVVIGQRGFCVKGLAAHLGIEVRPLERRFIPSLNPQLSTTPFLFTGR